MCEATRRLLLMLLLPSMLPISQAIAKTLDKH